jgi:hypothetical protein
VPASYTEEALAATFSEFIDCDTEVSADDENVMVGKPFPGTK